MIFEEPIPFKEALEYRAAQRILPTHAGTRELSELAPEIRERSFFSARTANAGYLAKMDRFLTDMTSPATLKSKGLTAIDPATFRLRMKAELAKMNYVPEKGKGGTLQDLGSDARLNLIIDTNLKQAYGYGQHQQAQDPDLLDLWPCWELVRIESRKTIRDWQSRWVGAGGALYGDRMIARKDASIWSAISRFGLPYPPFDFQSGMGVRNVRRDEAERLGVITSREIPTPQTRAFTENVETSFPRGISNGLEKALKQTFTVLAEKIILESAT